jgi:zinc/manganese transport system substrate-binding protein
MKNLIGGALTLFFLALAPASQAAVRVLATTADWGALTRELGGDRVDVYVATTAMQDVHHVEAKPSLVARARTADLLVANGAELEAGWLPVLLQESGNPRIQRGAPGFFEAASAVTLVEVPAKLDRAMGDIHPLGNPHLHLDPHNVAAVAKLLAAKLTAVDPAGADYYAARAADFDRRWTEAMARWQAKAAPLRDMPVVIMHRDQSYLRRWLGLRELAAIEPKPGVPPSAGYLGELVTKLAATPPKMILLNAYNDPKAANWLANRVHAPAVVLPYSVGGSPGAKDLFGLFEDTLAKLLGAVR